MGEGAVKYGKHNWRVEGVRASIYYDATLRHLLSWFDGEDVDPDSGVHHVSKAIASLMVLRDAMIQNNCVDDRPPSSVTLPVHEGNVAFKAARDKYDDCGLHYDRESIRQREQQNDDHRKPSNSDRPS